MQKKIWIPALSILLAGAITASVILLTKNAGSAMEGDLMKGVSKSQSQAVQLTDSGKADFKEASVAFTGKLFKETVEAGKNSMISPPSVFLALGLTQNGADGETLKEFEALLSGGKLTANDLNSYYQNYISSINNVKKSTKLSVANSIWCRQGLSPKKDFLQRNADYFGADMYTLDFSAPEAPERINKWVDENTNHLIKKIIDKIPAQTVMYLINTVYFNAKWAVPFNKALNSTGEFTLSDGSKVQTVFMNAEDTFGYLKTDAYEMAVLPYDDNQFSFAVLLPKEGTAMQDFVKRLDAQAIENMTEAKPAGLRLSIPKFETEYEIKLNDPLIRMGLASAFDGGSADFSRMVEGGGLYIGEAKHKTFIRVDEIGTEAGAATSIAMDESAMLDVVTLNLNRPFVYAVIDKTSGIPLFLGTMENPTVK